MQQFAIYLITCVQSKALSITQILEGYFGFVMLVIVLVPFFINNPELGSFTFSMKLYIYISSGFVTLGLLWPSFFGHFRHVTCETNFQAASLYLFPCAVQGVPFHRISDISSALSS